jgi:hypothetical protein
MSHVAFSRCLAAMDQWLCDHNQAQGALSMMDVLMLALGFGFFALAISYTHACERL